MRRTPTFLAATVATGALIGPAQAGAAAPPPPYAQAGLPSEEQLPALAVPGDGAAVLAAEATGAARDRLVRRAMRVARKLAAVQGRELRDGYEPALRTFSSEDLEAKHRELRRDLRRARSKARERARERREARRAAGGGRVSMPAHLAAIAQCESGGNPRAIGGGGAYRGLFQFSPATWRAVGGSGDPAAAPVAEQVKRAQMLYAQAGPGQWPVCGS